MGKVKITILCENTASPCMGITGEHGFSALIEKDGEKLLMDAGQGLSLLNNARTLRVDLTEVKRLVLSHGHFDHTGGLPQVLAPPRGVEIIAHPDIFDSKYADLETPEGKKKIFIGMKFSRDWLENGLKAVFNFQKGFIELSNNIFYSGEVPRKTEFEHPDPRLLVKRNGSFEPDPLLDDISLLIETDKGPVILLGCAHAGTVNVMKHFSEKTGHEKFHAVIGGTHLGLLGNPDQLEKTMDAFDEFDVQMIAVSHCTGSESAAAVYGRFKERFAFANAGWSATF
jgi:7,8-dihydropterin-6-yl-methyl-4-(beta-D-ribofuranosyl)aminobenzene 5'-phosphate synthase